MPPLAVVGYGLATSQWSIARGAALLFLTNMVAISASAALMAEWYGFGRGGIRKAFARQALVSLALLAPLSIPLFLSLRDIAQESYAQTVIRRTIEAQVAGLDGGQLARLQVRFDEDEAIHADAMVVTDDPRPGFREEARAAVEKALGRPVTLSLHQVRAEDSPARAQAASFGRLLEAPVAPAPASPPVPDLAQTIRAATPIPLRSVESDESAKSLTILAGAHAALDLEAYRAMETGLADRHRDWKVQLVPPLIPLPEIRFESGSHALSPSAMEALETTAWALSRWELKDVEVSGYASSDRSGTRSLAARRAEEVARWLEARGFAARAVARFPEENQAARERALGREAFRKAVIVPAAGGAGRSA
jgi:outer membrane protein OmpA-like peptidoglycan-associated protein